MPPARSGWGSLQHSRSPSSRAARLRVPSISDVSRALEPPRLGVGGLTSLFTFVSRSQNEKVLLHPTCAETPSAFTDNLELWLLPVAPLKRWGWEE